jgi:ribosomal protein S27E
MSNNKKTECKGCKKVLVRHYAEKRAGGRRYYTAPDGRFWSGRFCPDCHNKRRVKAYAYSRAPALDCSARMIYIAPGSRIRKCQTCAQDTANYFNCNSCHQRLVQAMGGEGEYYTSQGGGW